ncbi:MAG: hypothetical protein UHU21_08330 [Lachnospiraceae bacterium]|jgi:hypothetical protein|nr:hypothetical protein [Oscillospiraceae bacterium]MEE1163687.1 hypothetical protein [Lachnospiraceae bacterium]
MKTAKIHRNKRKKSDIHSLYPEDHRFDWQAYEADPENYVFTKEDIAYGNTMELERYELETPMTPYEKRALRRWVASGHSVMEPPPSRYPCVHCKTPPPGFLEVYRTDRELDAATKGMSKGEKTRYLQEYAGFSVEPDEERCSRGENARLHIETPDKAKETIRKLKRELCYTWMFLMEEGLFQEAEEFVKSRMDEPTPFEDEW